MSSDELREMARRAQAVADAIPTRVELVMPTPEDVERFAVADEEDVGASSLALYGLKPGDVMSMAELRERVDAFNLVTVRARAETEAFGDTVQSIQRRLSTQLARDLGDRIYRGARPEDFAVTSSSEVRQSESVVSSRGDRTETFRTHLRNVLSRIIP